MDIINHSTESAISPFLADTSRWSLVVHKVTTSTVNIWAGTLFPHLRKPQLCRLILFKGDTQLAQIDLNQADWQRPFRRLSRRFYVTRMFTNLEAGADYKVVLYQRLEDGEYAGQDKWLKLKSAYFTTLPMALPTQADQAFTVSLNSCFYEHKDAGQAAEAYKALYTHTDKQNRPDLKFMVGDQVYLDIGADSLSPLTNEIRERIADDYASHWRALGSMLSRGAAWMLPDDHEYWNDYPFYDRLLPHLFMLKISRIRNAWRRASQDGVNNIQQTSKVDTFTIGNDLSFCVADFRSYRSKTQFIDQAGFKQLEQWATQLTGPGVLVCSQILIDEKKHGERNLLSFKRQYAKLLAALASSGHDIVVLAGDVHFGRVCSVPLGESGARLIEVAASPLSNLTGINSCATATASEDPVWFPDPKADIPSTLAPQKVDYHNAVSTQKGHFFTTYWRERTKEHLMTISFHQAGDGVQMAVKAWRVRDIDKQGLPSEDFTQAYTTNLR